MSLMFHFQADSFPNKSIGWVVACYNYHLWSNLTDLEADHVTQKWLLIISNCILGWSIFFFFKSENVILLLWNKKPSYLNACI